MTPRDKRMLGILGVLLLGAVVFGGYLLILSPWLEARDQAAKLRKEIADFDERTLALGAKAAKVKEYTERSLPPEISSARREYDFVITEICRKAGIPSPVIAASGSDTKDRDRIPVLPNPDSIAPTAGNVPGGGTILSSGKEKPAYQKIGTKITLTKVDLKMLGEFLRAYHDISLLHHISSMRITRKDDAAAGSTTARRTRDRSHPDDWKDLEVVIVSEAIVLDGVEDRKSLIGVPRSLSALAGQVMAATTTGKSEYGRFFAIAQAAAKQPKPDAVAGVDGGRFYASLVGRDLFHGPIPKDPTPPKPAEVVIVPPPPPIDQYIRLNEITRRGDGSASFQMRDLFNNFTYHGDLKPKGESTLIEINKNSISPNGKPIMEYQYQKELKIEDDGKSSSTYVFQVVAVDTVEGLILMGPPLKSDPKAGAMPGGGSRPAINNGGGRTFGRPTGSSTKLPTPQPVASLTGGWVATLPSSTDVLYYLKYGHSLKDMKKLTATEVREIVRRNAAEGFNPYLNPNVTLPSANRDAVVELVE